MFTSIFTSHSPAYNSYCSLAFFMYTLIVYLIHLSTASGRNAPTKTAENADMSQGMWYDRVPLAEERTPVRDIPLHTIGEDD